ncbi:sugar ABC transporter permease [Tenericutes bacterium MZ-XQ]|jgi:multiple sugar transport system permease protein|nr:sugar ABC transporter permease [Tenericutes bacterium MZ-XQ]
MNHLQKNIKFYIVLFLVPSILGYIIFSLLPMLSAFYLSFTSWDIIGGTPDWIGITNYKDIFSSDEFYRVLKNTLKFIVMYIPLIMISSFLLALLFDQKVKGVGAFRVLLFIPVLTSWVAGSIIWRSALNGQYGIINNLLDLVGIQGPGWLTDPKWSMVSIVMVSIWKDLGFFSLIIFGALRNVDKEVYEAAEIDGASSFKKTLKITLPLVSPTLFFVLITTMINSFQLFPQVMVMTGGGPFGSTQVLVERIYTYGFRYFNMGYAAALSIVLLIMIVIVTIIQLVFQKKWVFYE